MIGVVGDVRFSALRLLPTRALTSCAVGVCACVCVCGGGKRWDWMRLDEIGWDRWSDGISCQHWSQIEGFAHGCNGVTGMLLKNVFIFHIHSRVPLLVRTQQRGT